MDLGMFENVDRKVLEELAKTDPKIKKVLEEIKKNEVSLNWYDYNLGIIAQSGFGKTTMAYEICHKYLGQDGYIHLNIGNEDGIDALKDVNYYDVKSFTDLTNLVDSIVKYKEVLFPNLKMIIFDTMDELIPLAHEETIKLHNRATPTKKVTTINQAFGGFQAGQRKARSIIIDEMDRLKKVGVRPFEVFHAKTKTKDDAVTGTSYDIITSKMQESDFEEFKTKLHVLGMGYIDRSIKTEEKEGFMGKIETTGKIVDEKRIIGFRNVNGALDSKSRLENIVPEIVYGADNFIKAIEDAIAKEFGEGDMDKAREIQEEEKAKKTKQASELAKKKEAYNKLIEEIKTAEQEKQKEILEVFKKSDLTIEKLKEFDNYELDVYQKLIQVLQ